MVNLDGVSIERRHEQGSIIKLNDRTSLAIASGTE
jgi:hypothetical protein